MEKVKNDNAGKPEKKETPKSLQELLNEKLEKISSIQKLTNKYNYLLKTQQNLNEFVLTSDGTNDRLTIQDSQRREFQTTNTDTIKRVVSILKDDLKLKLAENQQQINEATI